MNKDKHALPEGIDIFADRVKREARDRILGSNRTTKIIYGPDNQPLRVIEVE